MKWSTTVPSPGQEDHTAADALFQFAKQNSIPIRGHNVLWDFPLTVQGWVSSLSLTDLAMAEKKGSIPLCQGTKARLLHGLW